MLGEDHEFTLYAAIGVATDLVLARDVPQAIELGQGILRGSRRIWGADHPHTLACAANLALDQVSISIDEPDGAELHNLTIDAMRRTLGPNHPRTIDVERGKRLECDIDPPIP